jgi:hypothetical protein
MQSMSRHFIHLHQGDRKITVVAGYDRPLRELFLHVVHDNDTGEREETFLFDSLDARGHDWTDINTVADQLALLAIEVPASMIEGIFLDQCFNAGNRVVEHYVDQPAVVRAAG